MADISAELAAIESAVYGEEVRDAIHDGLEKMNSDLNTAIGTQVIDRASVEEVIGTSFDFVLNPSENYVDLSDATFVEGSYIQTDGTIANNGHFCYTSSYIEIPERVKSLTVNRSILVLPDNVETLRQHMIWFYDTNQTLLGNGTETLGDTTLTTVPPANAKYFRANFSKHRRPYFVQVNFDREGFVNDVIDDTIGYSLDFMVNASENYVDLSDATFVEGSYIQTDGTIDVNGHFCYTSSYVEIPQNTRSLTVNRSVLVLPDNVEILRPHMIWFYDTNQTLIGNGTETLGTKTLTAIPPENAKYFRANFSAHRHLYFVQVNFDHEGVVNDKLGYIGQYSGSFSRAKVNARTPMYLHAGTDYIIKFLEPHTGSINIYLNGITTPYRNAQPFMNEVHFTPTSDGYLTLYNVGSVIEAFKIAVYKGYSSSYKAENEPKRYIVSKTASRADYTSLTQCFLDLKDDTGSKIIEIWEGEYDLYQEYLAAGVPIYTGSDPSLDYFDYCVWVPHNTHLIGKGIVRLKWMPDPANDSITPNQCKCVSPLNVAGNAIIENVEVYCKNGRYCLHNDALGKTTYSNTTQIYKNVRFYKYANDTNTQLDTTYGFAHTTGFGLDKSMHHVYENCVFVNYGDRYAFYGHTRPTAISGELESSDITLTNCALVTGSATAVQLGNDSSRTSHIRMMFNSCSIPGTVNINAESNVYDIQFLNCGSVSFKTTDASNPYPPQAYNTQLTVL